MPTPRCPKLQGTGFLYIPGPQASALGLTPDADVTPVVLDDGILALVPGHIEGMTSLLCQPISETNGAVRIRLRRLLVSWGLGTMESPQPVSLRLAGTADRKMSPLVIQGSSVIVDLRLLLNGGELP
jgi:hypothetical protein